MTKNFYFLLLLIFTISCSNPVKKEKITEESINKELDKARSLQNTVNVQTFTTMVKGIQQRAKSINYEKGIVNGNNVLLTKLFNSGNFKEVLEIGKQNEILIEKIKNNSALCTNNRLVGGAYLEMGLLDEGLSYLKKALESNKKIESPNKKYYELSLLYSGFGKYEAMRTDSLEPVQKYNKMELRALEQIDDSKEFELVKNDRLAFSYMSIGLISYKQNKVEEAENYYHKAINICKKYNIKSTTPIITYDEMSWLLYEQKRYDSCISYAQQGAVLEKKISSPYIRRDILEVLYKSYTEKGDTKNSSKYGNLYIKLNDSLTSAEKQSINAPVKNIISQNEKEHETNLLTILIIIGSAVSVLTVLTFYFWRRSQRIFHQRYELLINQLKSNSKDFESDLSEKEPVIIDRSINIHDSTATAILQKLNRFEKSEKFLRKETNLTSLANALDTNPKYLSEIIKQSKEKNFNNYLNGLRIHYIIQTLYKEPIFREYKITYLAEHCGFASREVFAIAFKKETQVTPSYFINQLRNDQQKQMIS